VLKQPTKELLEEEKHDYEQALVAGPKFAAGSDVDIGMRVVLVHGDEVGGAWAGWARS
jgi:hypothetical protein